MTHTNANPATGDGGARKEFSSDDANTYIRPNKKSQAPIVGRLFGDDRCTARGIEGRGHVPILALCRELLAAGIDPDRALDVYRGSVLALRIRSIGKGALLTVKTAGNGAPIFAARSAAEGATAPPMRLAGGGAS